ncbi:hypothetical protein As57867_011712, partial [Aphanomyces stellatus]
TIEPIDECTVYTHMTDKHHDTMCHGHILVKHYAVEGREILIGRSILDDPAHPTPRGDLIEDSTFWVEAVALPGQDACLFTSVVRLNLGRFAAAGESEIDSVVALLESASIAHQQSFDMRGILPSHAVGRQLSPPPRLLTLGNLHIYLARSVVVEEAFKRAINCAIERHGDKALESTGVV